MRALRQLLGIDYRDHVTNVTVRNIVTSHIGRHQELLQIVKSRKLKWFGHTTRGAGLAKMCLQGTVRGGRSRGRPRKKWSDNITEWTGLSYAEATRAAGCREGADLFVRLLHLLGPYSAVLRYGLRDVTCMRLRRTLLFFTLF